MTLLWFIRLVNMTSKVLGMSYSVIGWVVNELIECVVDCLSTLHTFMIAIGVIVFFSI